MAQLAETSFEPNHEVQDLEPLHRTGSADLPERKPTRSWHHIVVYHRMGSKQIYPSQTRIGTDIETGVLRERLNTRSQVAVLQAMLP